MENRRERKCGNTNTDNTEIKYMEAKFLQIIAKVIVEYSYKQYKSEIPNKKEKKK